LILSNNHIDKLSKNAFYGLDKSLLILNLTGNKLDFIKIYYFEHLSILQVLELSRNNILSIEVGSFDGLTSLNQLDLSFNCLFKIQDDLFYRMSNLKILNLNMNMIKYLNLKSLRAQKQLADLILSHNLIEKFNLNTNEALQNLSSIDVSFNPILKTFYLSPRLSFVNLDGNSHVQLTIPRVRNIRLRGFYGRHLSYQSLMETRVELIPKLGLFRFRLNRPNRLVSWPVRRIEFKYQSILALRIDH
jgi:Leucine-rich repeat (LRR) protein